MAVISCVSWRLWDCGQTWPGSHKHWKLRQTEEAVCKSERQRKRERKRALKNSLCALIFWTMIAGAATNLVNKQLTWFSTLSVCVCAKQTAEHVFNYDEHVLQLTNNFPKVDIKCVPLSLRYWSFQKTPDFFKKKKFNWYFINNFLNKFGSLSGKIFEQKKTRLRVKNTLKIDQRTARNECHSNIWCKETRLTKDALHNHPQSPWPEFTFTNFILSSLWISFLYNLHLGDKTFGSNVLKMLLKLCLPHKFCFNWFFENKVEKIKRNL